MSPNLHLTGDDASDALLSSSPLALMIGMLLDQQVRMESAFAGPAKIRDRMAEAGHSFDADTIAGYEPDAFAKVFTESPSVHRFPGSMATRVQEFCAVIVDDWSADPERIWTRDAPDATEILARLRSLPGYGEQKAKILLALLGKQCGLIADGWRDVSMPYGEEGAYRSVADAVDADSIARVRATKKAAKDAAKKAK